MQPVASRQTGSLLFGRMYEDPAIELEAFAPSSRVFCIASSGCTARTLAAAGHIVTAVDINSAQIEYARSRADGGPVREGAADRLICRLRSLLGLIGWSHSKRTAFLQLDNPEQQLDYWHHNLDSRRWRTALDSVLSPQLLSLAYAGPFVDFIGRNFGELIRARLCRCWANHPNRSNPYAWSLFLRPRINEPAPPIHPIRFACADAATFLENCSPQSFDAFSLSNIVDAAPPDYIRRLHSAMLHAATRGAIAVTRSFAEPISINDSNHAARDRSPLWGSVDVLRVGEQSCSNT